MMSEGVLLRPEEIAYLMGNAKPATSSVLVSSSKYLNSPLFRDTYAQMGLRRHGPDLPITYLVPAMYRAIAEVTDFRRTIALVETERKRLPEFAAWLDERFISNFKLEMVEHCADGTLGAHVRDFILKSGLELDFIITGHALTDYEFLIKRSIQYHDILHMVTGFCTSEVGEVAIVAAMIISNANYFSEELAHELDIFTKLIVSTSLSRFGLHYPRLFPVLLDAISRANALGSKQKKPLFMIRWEDYFDRTLCEIRSEFSFEDGPECGYWDWTDREIEKYNNVAIETSSIID